MTLYPNSQSTTIAVGEAIKLIQSIDGSRNTILAQMQEFCKSLPEYSVIRKMPCIGDTLAPRIIAEIGGVALIYEKTQHHTTAPTICICFGVLQNYRDHKNHRDYKSH